VRHVTWHDALLAIEQEDGVVLLLVAPTPSPADVTMQTRVTKLTRYFAEEGYVTLCVTVDEDCAVHPELAAVYLPQLRVFDAGDLTCRRIGVLEDDSLQEMV
jgi:ABC-type hemin transport system ATPase subunit